MQISDKAVNAVKPNIICVAHLMILFKKGQWTINKMLDDKDIRMTAPAAVKIIAEHTGLTENVILVHHAELAATG